MAKNYVQVGGVWDHTPSGAAVASGDVVVMEDTVGVAITDIADGDTGAIQVCDVFTLAKATGTAIGQGKKVYWNSTDGEIVATATGNTYAGRVAVTAESAAAEIQVDLNK